MKTVDIASHVAATKMIGSGNQKQVLLIVNDKSVTSFKDSVVAASDIRRTRRWMPERDVDNAVREYVRTAAGFHGKRLTAIQVVAATNKPDLVRTAKGTFMKI